MTAARAVVMPPCPIHHSPTVCPRCMGAKGGRIGGLATSAKKTRAARRNATRPRPRPPKDV
jgi:hypothetical protein